MAAVINHVHDSIWSDNLCQDHSVASSVLNFSDRQQGYIRNLSLVAPLKMQYLWQYKMCIFVYILFIY